MSLEVTFVFAVHRFIDQHCVGFKEKHIELLLLLMLLMLMLMLLLLLYGMICRSRLRCELGAVFYSETKTQVVSTVNRDMIILRERAREMTVDPMPTPMLQQQSQQTTTATTAVAASLSNGIGFGDVIDRLEGILGTRTIRQGSMMDAETDLLSSPSSSSAEIMVKNGSLQLTVCPSNGTMAGVMIAAKNSVTMIGGIFGGKKTKHRW